MLDTRQLRYFVAVAEELSFSRAATRLGISQPPLSQHIRALEESFGLRLFDRSTRMVRLTRAGSVLLVEARKVLDQATRSADLIERVRRGDHGQLFIGTITSACLDILPRFLAQLNADRPGISIALRERDTARALVELAERRLDLAFVRLDRVDAPLRLKMLREESFVLAVPESHPLASVDAAPLSALDNEPLALVSRDVSSRFFDAIVAAFASKGITPRIAHECSSIQSQVSFVSSGLCCALVPSSNQLLRVPGVVYVPLEEDIRLTGIALAWRDPPEDAVVVAAIDAAGRAF